MYEYITGKLVISNPHYAVIEANGIGYKVWVPSNLFYQLPGLGEELKLFVSFVVRELSQALYGFITREERDLFEILLSLSGIGPKTALAILGHFKIEDFTFAIKNQDLTTLSKVPGIGKKTAERLVVDLKGKLDTFSHSPEASPSHKLQDALNALIQLGYSPNVARNAIKKASESLASDCEISELIGHALRFS